MESTLDTSEKESNQQEQQPAMLSVRSSPVLPVLLFVGTMVLILGGDLWVKYWSFENVAAVPVELQKGFNNVPQQIPYHNPMALIPSVISMRLTLNTGAIFGIGKGGQWFFVTVSIIATTFICYLFWKSAAKAYAIHICYALVLGGALGNMYDRMVYNAVRDMFWLFPGLHLPFGLNWPGGSTDVYPWLFNVADVALIVGVLMLMLLVHLADRRLRKSAKKSD